MKTNDLIKRLQQLSDENDNPEINIYLSYSKENRTINVSNVNFDDDSKDVYIGIYG